MYEQYHTERVENAIQDIDSKLKNSKCFISAEQLSADEEDR